MPSVFSLGRWASLCGPQTLKAVEAVLVVELVGGIMFVSFSVERDSSLWVPGGMHTHAFLCVGV
jgi:hypothetical protein